MNSIFKISSVTVVIPTYNEAGNIVPLIEQIIQHVGEKYKLEVIVVDDSSPDGTARIALDRFGADDRIKVVQRTEDKGLGSAVGHGMSLATSDVVVGLDADLTHNPSQIPDMVHVCERFDLVSGSRFAAGGSMQDKAHYFSSFVFNLWVRILLGTQIQDNLAGFFVVRRSVLNKLPQEKIFFGYGDYFIRLLYFAQRSGASVVEIPTHYTLRTSGSSKSNYLKMVWTYSSAAVRVLLSEKRILRK
jgi:dolichol-phosphate mannosyltransferase